MSNLRVNGASGVIYPSPVLPHNYHPGDELPRKDTFENDLIGIVIDSRLVGMGCTHGYGCDYYPGTIIRCTPSGSTIWVVDDRYEYIGPPREYGDDGKPEDWRYYRTDATVGKKATLRKDGKFRFVGEHGSSIALGFRRYRLDPHH